MKQRHLIIPLTAIAAATLLTGFSVVNNKITWNYFGTPKGTGSAPTEYTASSGMPTITEFSTKLPTTDSGGTIAIPVLPSSLYNDTLYLLPEGQDIRTNTRGVTLNGDDASNIVLDPTKNSEVFVTFVSEGAGYLNSVGYFLYDADHPPTSRDQVTNEKIIFANASMDSPLQHLTGTNQYTVSLGKITPLTSFGQPVKTGVGFFIVSNGYKTSGARTTSTGTKVAGVNEGQDPAWVFYTLKALNPEPHDSRQLDIHTVLLAKDRDVVSDAQQMVIGFEDIKRDYGGDHDFNDVILAVTVTPQSAITNLKSIPTLALQSDPDTDGDGVKDSLDEFPNDPTKAFSRYYPDQNSYGTLAYEDQWPLLGDFDMNDIVVRYKTREIMNAQRKVVGLEIDYKLAAHGGQIKNGFAVQLPGILSSSVTSATLQTISPAGVMGSAVATTPESDAKGAVFKIFDDADAHFSSVPSGCSYYNTEPGCDVTASQFHLSVTFNTAMNLSQFTPPYNPFIFRTGVTPRYEVHLPGQQPTSAVNAALFKTGVDNTTVGTTNTYMTSGKLPWAMNIPIEWQYPKEAIDLLVPYPNLNGWATSGGASNKDWYVINGATPAGVFTPKK